LEATHLIRKLTDELALTLILVEHDMNVVMEISDQVMVLYEGSVLAEGSPENISDNQRVQEVYLGKR
jgi:branched-chain amino acid transport system ATP-binding protein